MLRAKSPFKKKSPKIEQGEEMPAPARPLLHHYSSVQEFHELQKQQHLMNSNAWAQQKVRSRTNSASAGELVPSLADESTHERTEAKTPKPKRKVPAPLKLIPEAASEAIPTQRDSLENKKHRVMQAQLSLLAHENDEEAARLRSSTVSSPNASVEHLGRPKSPGKKLFQKFFRQHTSTESPPKISLEFEETPEKAAKILGKESLTRKKASKAAKLRTSEEQRILSKLDFKCVGDETTRSRANTDTSTDTSPSTAEFDAPTDCEIRSIGGVGRHATRAATSAMQRTVSDTATIQATVSGDGLRGRSSDFYPFEHHHKHLRYMNNAIPPTPPSKDTRREKRPAVTEVPPMDVAAVLNDDPNTPDTAFRVMSKGEKAMPTPNAYRNDYLHLVLNKPSIPSLRGNSSIRSAYGFVISPSAELANGGVFGSPTAGPQFIESPSVSRSAGLPSSRETSFGSSKVTPPRSRRLSRRWSDTSLAAWKVQVDQAMPCLPPTFYSPYNFNVPANYRNFTRPSANDDPSLYHLPQAAAVGDLESCASSEGKGTPPTSAESSFSAQNNVSYPHIPNEEATPVAKQRRFVAKKRCSSNIAAAARNHAAQGLRISTGDEQNMHQEPIGSVAMESASFPRGPPSAIPPPLNVMRSKSSESLPANEELDAFLSLHLHLDHSTGAIHRIISHSIHESVNAMKKKHNETMELLTTSFADLLSKVNSVGEQNNQNSDGMNAFKVEMNGKIMDLTDLVQSKVLGPVSQVVDNSAKLDHTLSHLLDRVVALEKNQKELMETIALKSSSREHSMAASSSRVEPAAVAATNASPHHSYVGAPNYAVTYAPPYTNNHATANSGAYSYIPYYADNGAYASAPRGWTGQSLDAGFAKMPREQRLQHLQGRHPVNDAGGSVQMPGHPAFKNGDRKSGGGISHTYGKDGANDI